MNNEMYRRIVEREPVNRFNTGWIDMTNEIEGKAQLEEVLEAADKYHASHPNYISTTSIQTTAKNVDDNGYVSMEISFYEP